MIEYPQENKGRGGIWLFFLPILIPLGIGVWFLWVYLQVRLHYTLPVPGNPRAFDPVASFVEAQRFAGADAKFQSLDAEYVSPDGTLNFEAGYTPAPHLKYTFNQLIPTPANEPPVGAGGSGNGKWMRTVTIALGKKGRYAEISFDAYKHVDGSFNSQGMDKEEGYPQPDDGEPALAAPTCRFADLWKVALEHGAPKNAVAEIEYDKFGYRFNISSSSIDLEFDTNCKLTTTDNEPVDELEPSHMN